MRIKKKHQNKYILSSLENGLWVRDFTKQGMQQYVDINKLIDEKDFPTMLQNEKINAFKSFELIENYDRQFPYVVIVSDGYDFEKKMEFLVNLPRKVAIFGVNQTLAKWNIKLQRAMNLFITNNPYKDCLLQIPTKHQYFPACVASNRTHHDFFKKYKGYIYKYYPAIQETYTGISRSADYRIDDYRNPICAAINIAYRLGVKKLLLFCCDDSFEKERPGATQLENGLWTYPQQITANNLIDANLYWLKNNQQEREIEVKNHSCGPKYLNAPYINKEEINSFFEEANNE